MKITLQSKSRITRERNPFETIVKLKVLFLSLNKSKKNLNLVTPFASLYLLYNRGAADKVKIRKERIGTFHYHYHYHHCNTLRCSLIYLFRVKIKKRLSKFFLLQFVYLCPAMYTHKRTAQIQIAGNISCLHYFTFTFASRTTAFVYCLFVLRFSPYEQALKISIFYIFFSIIISPKFY